MKLQVLSASVLLLAAAAGAQEPPPPPVEAAVAPGARAIDPRADDLVRRMSDLLARTASFALEAEEVFDELAEDLPRIQFAGKRHLALQRPDRLASDVAGDALNRAVWYDGKTLTALNREQNVYAAMAVPNTIDGALDTALERSGTVIPLADFLYSDVHARLMGSVERGVYVGLHEAAGVPCHHLSFEQPTLDWQLWIDAGPDPLPRKLLIAYKAEEGVPQYAVTIRKWNLKAVLPAELFHFDPPPGATRVEIPAFLAPADAAPGAPGSPKPDKKEKP